MSPWVRIIGLVPVPYRLRPGLALLLAILGCGDVREAPAPASLPTASASAVEEAVLFVGTSLTAGYGLPPEQAYPALIDRRLEAAGLAYRVVNAGVSGDTSAGARRRIGWLLQQPVAAVVLELGANDMLRGQDPARLRENLQAMIDEVRAAFPAVPILLVGMRAAPNLGSDYARAFEAVFPDLAAANEAALLPFLLDGVAGIPRLNQADGIHPTAEGQRRVAENVWSVLGPQLGVGRAAP